MSEGESRHLRAEAFRQAGYAAVDWVVDFYERVESLPVMPSVRPGEVRALLPEAPPERGEPFDAILADLDRVVVPGTLHWQSPNFFGYFPANASPPAILAELISAGLGTQGMLWQTGPACTEVETHMLDWLVGMLGLPEKFLSGGKGGGVIQDSASSATLCALLAARERASACTAREAGSPDSLVAYCSTDTHSSMEKAMSIAGLGRARLRKIETDAAHALSADALARAMDADVDAGLRPFFVCATAGTTSSLAIDPVARIGEICARHGAWLHVDAAMVGTAALCEEFRYVNDGVEAADSYCFNPHKWMLVNFDCDCLWVADREPLIQALTVMPEYLRNEATDTGAAIDYRDWQIPLGRRFRALKLWFVIRSYGVEGLRAMVREHVALAARFADWVDADPDFELAAPRSLNLVCFRRRGSDEENRALMRRLNESGRLFLTHTVLEGRFCLRLCVGQASTAARHVEAAWQAIRTA